MSNFYSFHIYIYIYTYMIQLNSLSVDDNDYTVPTVGWALYRWKLPAAVYA